MDLLELKSVWEAVVDDTIAREKVDDSAVEKSINKDSKSVLAKIKRVMHFKFLFGGLTLVLCITLLIGSFIDPVEFAFYESIFDITDNRIFLITGIVFLSAMLSWNFRAFREIKRFQRRATSIKESLSRFIAILGHTIKLNIYSAATFNSFAFGWLGYLANNKLGFIKGTWQITFMVIGLTALGAIVFYFLSRFEQKFKFGNYLDQLKSYQKDLDEK